MNVAEIKKELQALGISTSTPGLFGDDRFEELKCRLEEATHQKHSDSARIDKREGNDTTINPTKHEALGHLSIAELRSRLTSLGISTSTPGLSGEERWNALMKRLMEAICGSEESHIETIENPKSIVNESKLESRFRKPPEDDVPTMTAKATEPVEEAPQKVEAPDIYGTQMGCEIENEEKDQEAIAASTINELKKQIKRVSNKRSIYIAAKLSGSNQDSLLKSLSDKLNQIEADITTCKGLQQRGETKVRLDALKHKSQGNGLGHGKQTMLFVEDTLAQLDFRRDDIKKEINVRRNEIKEEAEIHVEFGIEVEEKLKQQISQAALQNTKVSRARKKIADSQAIDQSVSTSIKRLSSTKTEENDLPESQSISSVDPHEITALRNEIPKKELEFPSSFLGRNFDLKSTKSSLSSIHISKPTHVASALVEENESLTGTSNADLEKGLFDYAAKAGKQHLPLYEGIRVEENSNRAKFRMGLDRPPPPRNPPPNIPSQRSESDDEESDSNSDKSSDNDDNVNESDEEDESTDEDAQPQASTATATIKTLSIAQPLVPMDGSINLSVSRASTTVPVPIASPQVPSNIAINQSNQISSALTPVETRNNNTNNEDSELLDDHLQQLRVLREHAKTLERLDDLLAAEVLHERALELDPTDIVTLQGFAVFLHKKRGELARAEAFFSRALQICLPGLHSNMQSPSKKKQENFSDILLLTSRSDGNGKQNQSPLAKEVQHLPNAGLLTLREERFKLKNIVSLLLNFANFMEKAKGDAEAAAMLLHKAVSLAPNDAFGLATLAHFSTLHKGVCKELSPTDTDELFRKALRLEPKNAMFMMWYGKFLKKRKKMGPAELMYRSAVDVSKGNKKIEPTTQCNYATFLFKHRKKVEKASEIFIAALERFPDHKGLRKNYLQLVKVVEKRQEAAVTEIGVAPIPSSSSREDAATPIIVNEIGSGSNITSQQASGMLTPSLPPRSAAHQSSNKGSRRAQRMVHSLVNKMPSDLESSESKTEFILSQLSAIAQEEVLNNRISRKLDLCGDDDVEENPTVEDYHEEDFQAIDPMRLSNPGDNFLAAVSPTKSFRRQHPHLKYYDDDDDENID